MYAYDPNTKKIGKVADNLDWLDSSTFVTRKAQDERTSPQLNRLKKGISLTANAPW
jgi:hypothetical protein